MNELNLQNPDFRERITEVRINGDGMMVAYRDDKISIGAVKRPHSPNRPLDKIQHWFTDMNRKVTTFNEI
jgi:hypothetical protein